MYYNDDAKQRSGNLIRVYLCIFKDDFEGEKYSVISFILRFNEKLIIANFLDIAS